MCLLGPFFWRLRRPAMLSNYACWKRAPGSVARRAAPFVKFVNIVEQSIALLSVALLKPPFCRLTTILIVCYNTNNQTNERVVLSKFVKGSYVLFFGKILGLVFGLSSRLS